MKKKRVRLLVVDDNVSFTETIKEMAEASPPDYELTVRFADNESEVLSVMKEWDPSVIILDAHTSALNSLEALEHYMAEIVPVIVVSDTPSREIEASSLSRGAVGYLTKGESVEELELLLSNLGNVSIDFEVHH